MKAIKKWSLFTKSLCAFFFLLICLVLWSSSDMDFFLRRAIYEKAVRQVKTSRMTVGTEKDWKMSFTGSLTPLAPSTAYPGYESNIVSARRTSRGYVVSIIRNNEGHLGIYGYIFSDVPPTMIDTG